MPRKRVTQPWSDRQALTTIDIERKGANALGEKLTLALARADATEARNDTLAVSGVFQGGRGRGIYRGSLFTYTLALLAIYARIAVSGWDAVGRLLHLMAEQSCACGVAGAASAGGGGEPCG